MHNLADPLSSPWSKARSICLYVNGGAWATLGINLLTAENDGVTDSALTIVMLTLISLAIVQVIGSLQFKRDSKVAEEIAEENKRVQHLDP